MRRRWVVSLAVLALLGTAGGVAAYRAERRQAAVEKAQRLTGGDAYRAPVLMITYGCAGCHEIPDLTGPSGRVGPSLRAVADRVYIAGIAVNTPENLVRWIADPKAMNPRTAMPVTGISEDQARDVAAYLYARQ